MPSKNPKHKKTRPAADPKMGKKKTIDRCFISECNKPATHHEATSNVTKYGEKLNWKIDPKKKSHRAGLCKEHYKEFKKQRNKDEKYTRVRDFNPKNSPKPNNSPSHAFLE